MDTQHLEMLTYSRNNLDYQCYLQLQEIVDILPDELADKSLKLIRSRDIANDRLLEYLRTGVKS